MSFLNKHRLIIILLILSLGLFQRLYNINFESYWWDEMLGFWTADPNTSFSITYKRHVMADHTSLIYHYILKLFYAFFEYTPEKGRYVSVFLSLLCIPLIGTLAKQITSDRIVFYIVLFLISFNVYLIDLSQENRVNTLIFLSSIINIIFFKKILLNKNLLNYAYFSFSSFAGLSLTPFFFIILFTEIFYCLFRFIFLKKNDFKVIIAIIFSSILYLLLFYESILAITNHINYNNDKIGYLDFTPNLRFLNDLFFPKFFGSKIMGLIFLLIFLYLLFNNFKKIFAKESKYIFYIFLTIFSYASPFFVIYFLNTHFHDRYIVFVIIPIIMIISLGLNELDNKKIRNYLIILLFISVIINSIFEILNKNLSNPGFNKFVEDNKNYDGKLIYLYSNYSESKAKTKDELILDKNTIEILSNYLKKSEKFKSNNYKFIDLKNIDDYEKIWIICYQPSSAYKCDYEKLNLPQKKKIKTKLYKALSANLIQLE